MQDLATTALQVGDKVEALVEGDSLYYGGTLRDIQPDGRKGVVEYDDGDVQTIPMAWILPDQRKILYDGGEARDHCPGRERLWAGRSRAPLTVLSSVDGLTLRCVFVSVASHQILVIDGRMSTARIAEAPPSLLYALSLPPDVNPSPPMTCRIPTGTPRRCA